jgi:3-deoxy-D-manno-octulosonic-acid transferase
MINTYDIAYGLGLAVSSPLWLLARKSRHKVLGALRDRMGQLPTRDGAAPAVWIHAVSLGEINATRSLIDRLADRREGLQFIVSTTTATGFARGQELYSQNKAVTLIRFPLDFSWAVDRALDALRPSVVVLMELEVWPNFLKSCQARNIPVMLANGRITETSYRNYKRGKFITARMFRRLELICAQDQLYADRFLELGAPADRVRVTGTMKFDTAQPGQLISGVTELADSVGLRPGAEIVWVCGSTGPGEEPIILQTYRELLRRYPALRLVIVPRHPERFDEVAGLIEQAKLSVIRRSKPPPIFFHTAIPPVVLGDTVGELRKFYALADFVFVGRSLVDLGPRQHGSDMIEPAALGKPVIVGPFTHNFAEAMRKFTEAGAVRVAEGQKGLYDAAFAMIDQPRESKNMGRKARAVVKKEQGATDRHVAAVLKLLGSPA